MSAAESAAQWQPALVLLRRLLALEAARLLIGAFRESSKRLESL